MKNADLNHIHKHYQHVYDLIGSDLFALAS